MIYAIIFKFYLKEISTKKKYKKRVIVLNKERFWSDLEELDKSNEIQFVYFDKKRISLLTEPFVKTVRKKMISSFWTDYKDETFFLEYLNAHSKLKASKFAEEVKKNILENKKNHKILNLINLPDLIVSSDDPYYFDSIISKENFITEKSINSKVTFLDLNKTIDIDNKIVLIKSADPGYDFIFNKNIAGFITAYGGANSHMSIRALELNIPSAIGVGIDKFNKIKKTTSIILDCKNKKILF